MGRGVQNAAITTFTRSLSVTNKSKNNKKMVSRRGIEPHGLAVKGMRWEVNVFSLIRRLLCRKLAILTKGQMHNTTVLKFSTLFR
jgi:hypothetical protein